MKTSALWLALLSAALFTGCLLSLAVGVVAIPLDRVFRILLASHHCQLDPTEYTIVWQLRLPRILLASIVGAGLGIAGAGYQGLFRNPLADPFVIGASSGAALGATLAIVCGLQWSLFGFSPVLASALVGSLLAVTSTYGIASYGREVPTLSLLLTGVAVSSLISAIVSLVMFNNNEELFTVISWLMGSLSGRGWSTLGATIPLVLAGGLCVWLLSRSLDALTFGEETAASLGQRLGRLRCVVVVAASLTTAAAVAAGGIIGFIGLIAPHFARLFVGARHAYVIPASGLLGALLLLFADNFARTISAPAELPVGVVTALVGSPFFLYVLKQRQSNFLAKT